MQCEQNYEKGGVHIIQMRVRARVCVQWDNITQGVCLAGTI